MSDEVSDDARRSNLRKFQGTTGYLLAAAMILWVLFHVVTAGVGTLPNYQQRAVHLAGALAFAFLFYPGKVSDNAFYMARDVLFAAGSLVTLGYVFINYETIVQSTWFTDQSVEMVLGLTLFLLVLEGIRRTLGWLFVGLVIAFYLYAYYGYLIPGTMGHRGLSFERLVYGFYLSENSILGTLMGISATVVTLFLILGALLNASGAGDTFIRIAMRIGGRMRGGAGLVAVIGSAFMGMVNGSTVANVTSTGVLTIPLMRRLGFRRNLAGAVESVASTGGQIMPPVMGPGAFLMAELLGISYLQVASAALVPSLLFFLALLLGVYLFALRYGLQPLPTELIPSRREAFEPLSLITLLLPVGVLIFFIINRYTIQFSVFWALVTMLAMMVLLCVLRRSKTDAAASTRARQLAGLNDSQEQQPTALDVAASDAVLVKRLEGMTVTVARGLEKAALSIIYIAMIIAAAQIIVSLITLTGLGVTFSQIIVDLGADQLLLSLFLTMVIAIILGMGMPTPAAYAIGAAVLGPPLAELGLEVLPSHLFLYFFASASAITPPVAAGIFAAIAISGGTFLGTARYAMMLACSLFLLPYMFILNPELTLRADFFEVVPALVSALAGIIFISVSVIGHCFGPVAWYARILMGAGAITLIVPDFQTDLVGAALALVGLLLHLRSARVQARD